MGTKLDGTCSICLWQPKSFTADSLICDLLLSLPAVCSQVALLEQNILDLSCTLVSHVCIDYVI